MPPHLHPRSRMTTSLFTTTLMVSFLVVATPHLLPCPVDPRALADSPNPDALSGEPRRRRRRRVPREETCNDVMSEERRKLNEADEWATPKRECPVPKPGGLIRQVLSLKKVADNVEEPPSVTKQVETARRHVRDSGAERT
ncbi:hypothetical protein K458DRAFT_439411 [Lentithecium fluviatile CBS 122367]|uniref:Uncharacterized protein n=1 Tax=Lentithecium fluviatile CBS 122367 TaxID=1168545 RepID=A0A6G1JJW6_9PLEO|nr:hypothetical protein K458DRAFT_439411 [Lentithecium fluviatile CBS 122367]